MPSGLYWLICFFHRVCWKYQGQADWVIHVKPVKLAMKEEAVISTCISFPRNLQVVTKEKVEIIQSSQRNHRGVNDICRVPPYSFQSCWQVLEANVRNNNSLHQCALQWSSKESEDPSVMNLLPNFTLANMNNRPPVYFPLPKSTLFVTILILPNVSFFTIILS